MVAHVEERTSDVLDRLGDRIAITIAPLHSRMRWSVWVVVVLGLTTSLVRLPGFVFNGMFDRDESYLAVMGDVVRSGGSMYVDVIDRKPPVVPFIYAFVREWSVDMRAIRLVLAVLVFLNGLVVTAIVRRLTASRRSALFGGVLAIVGTAMFLPPDAQAANFELWGLLPASVVVLALVISRDAARPLFWFAIAGGSAMIAMNCKQTYVVLALPIVVEIWRRGALRLPMVLSAGAGALVVLGPIAWRTDPELMWRWVWLDNGDYLSGGLSMSRALLIGLGLTAVFCAFHLPYLYGVWASASRRVRIDPMVIAWVVGSALVIPIGFRFFGHYYQQLVTPLAVMTASAITVAGRRVWRVIVALTVISALALTALAFVHRPDLSDFTALGRYVQRTTDPDDRILVWGALPDVYVAAQRGPAGVFLHGGYLTGNWASRAEPLSPDAMDRAPFSERWAMFFADVIADPPVVVIDAARPGTDWAAYPPDRSPIGGWLSQCYQRAEVIDGLPVWRRDVIACPG